MSKFYQYINENYGRSRVESISESDAKDSVRYNCQKSAKSTPIYRHSDSFKHNLGFGDSASAELPRVSRNTLNYYTLIIDNSKPWKSFPLRSYSFICTTSSVDSEAYHRVIPFDGIKIGICPEPDIWVSFPLFRDVSILNEIINNAADSLNLNSKKMENDYNYLLNALDKIGEDYKDKNNSPSWIKHAPSDVGNFFRSFAKKSNKSLSNYLVDFALDPNNNDFKLKKAGNKIPKGKEVWFAGKAIFIKNDVMNKIIQEYGDILKWANDIENTSDKETMVT